MQLTFNSLQEVFDFCDMVRNQNISENLRITAGMIAACDLNKIQTIKLIRNITRMGLKEAKNLLEYCIAVSAEPNFKDYEVISRHDVQETFKSKNSDYFKNDLCELTGWSLLKSKQYLQNV